MTNNIYTEHANITTLYDREVEINSRLTMQRNILGFAWLIMFCSWLLMFAIGFRTDQFFKTECVNYPILPIVVPTPIQK